jgi:hypothetical protein
MLRGRLRCFLSSLVVMPPCHTWLTPLVVTLTGSGKRRKILIGRAWPRPSCSLTIGPQQPHPTAALPGGAAPRSGHDARLQVPHLSHICLCPAAPAPTPLLRSCRGAHPPPHKPCTIVHFCAPPSEMPCKRRESKGGDYFTRSARCPESLRIMR